jgi:hypothetical protein
MTKFLASITALAMAAGLAVAPQIASAQPGMGFGHHRCPRGSHWVPAHRNRMGHWVPGHCGRR